MLYSDVVSPTGVDQHPLLFSVEEYSFTTPLDLFLASGSYWLGIEATTSYDPWSWEDGTGGDGTHYRTSTPSGSVPDDLAFTVNGYAPAPEPSTFVMLGTGLLGVAGAARRRFHRS